MIGICTFIAKEYLETSIHSKFFHNFPDFLCQIHYFSFIDYDDFLQVILEKIHFHSDLHF